MVDDIVARLNSSYAFLRDPLHLEARDEINRLRAALQRIVDYGLVSYADLERALAVLEGEATDDAAT